MGCYTIYIVRELDGSLWWNGEKWGALSFDSPDQLLAAITNRLEPRPGFFDGAWCRGWYIDRVAKLARVYSCQAVEAPRLWPADWDVRVAAENRYDIAELIGEPYDADDHAQFLDAWRGCEAARLVTTTGEFGHRWDPLKRELQYEWYWHDGVDISVIDHDSLVTHYGFADMNALFAALGHGQILLDELATFAPCPELGDPYASAVIDIPKKTIFLWHRRPIAPTTYAALRARWPGWTIAREPGDIEMRLANYAPAIRVVQTS